jgi:hypothetical protein
MLPKPPERLLRSSFVVVALLAPSALAQVEQPLLLGDQDFSEFGQSIALLGDLDGDGAAEWLVAAPGHFPGGRVELRRGSDGAAIRTHDFASPGALFGYGLAIVDDLDGDTVPDYAIGAPRHMPPGGGPDSGRIEAYAGVDGHFLFGLDGNPGEWFGSILVGLDDMDGDGLSELLHLRDATATVISSSGARLLVLATNGERVSSGARVGDVDGDGTRDFAVGCHEYSGPLGREGKVFLFSGATGAPLSSFTGTSANDMVGMAMLGVADRDGDGIDDLLVGGRTDARLADFNGFIEVRSSATLASLWRKKGATKERFGLVLKNGGDWNGDGIGELLVLAGNVAPFGSVRVLSAKDGSLLHEFFSESSATAHDHYFGVGMDGGDFDGDGIGDALVGALEWHDMTGFIRYGAVHRYRGCPASSATYGAGFAGTLGVPALSLTGVPALGAGVTFAATNSLGAPTSGLLVVGSASASIPLRFGATLLVDPLSFELIAVPAAGWSDVDSIPSDPALAFADFFLQVLELDSGAAGGVSLTNGLQLTIGYDL